MDYLNSKSSLNILQEYHVFQTSVKNLKKLSHPSGTPLED